MSKKSTIAFCLLLTLICSGFAQHEKNISKNNMLLLNPTATQVEITDTLVLDSIILDAMQKYHMAGYSLCIIKNGQIHWQKNYGFAKIEDSTLVNDSTLFMLASVSKLFVATAIMQLEENELINLDTDVNSYLLNNLKIQHPDYPDDSVTVRMLLNHTSGLHDTWGVLDKWISIGDFPIQIDSLLKGYFTPGGVWYQSANFGEKPGTSCEYANMNFVLLAYIVECITGASYEEYCQGKIFKPLEMNQTSYFFSNLDTTKIAMPYKWNGSYKPYDYYGMGIYPACQLRTSSKQLVKFLTAIMNGGKFKESQILKSNTIEKMLTHSSYDPKYEEYYGLCWFETDDYGVLLWGHTGHYYGIATAMFFNPEERWGFISLSNTGYFDASYEGERYIAKSIVDYIITVKPEKNPIVIKNYHLFQNYPNPFNPSTTIQFQILNSEFTTLKVYNILGKEVSTLVSKKLYQGNHTYTFDGKNLASGIYYYQLVAGDFREVKKMILIR